MGHYNLVLVTHAEGARVALSMPPSHMSQHVEKVEFGGVFVATRAIQVGRLWDPFALHHPLESFGDSDTDSDSDVDLKVVGSLNRERTAMDLYAKVPEVGTQWHVQTCDIAVGTRPKDRNTAGLRLEVLLGSDKHARACMAQLREQMPDRPPEGNLDQYTSVMSNVDASSAETSKLLFGVNADSPSSARRSHSLVDYGLSYNHIIDRMWHFILCRIALLMVLRFGGDGSRADGSNVTKHFQDKMHTDGDLQIPKFRARWLLAAAV